MEMCVAAWLLARHDDARCGRRYGRRGQPSPVCVHAIVHAYNLHVIRELVPLCGVWCNDIPERATIVCEPPADRIVRDVTRNPARSGVSAVELEGSG